MVREIFSSSIEFVTNLRQTRELEEEEARQNPFLAQALERENMKGIDLPFSPGQWLC